MTALTKVYKRILIILGFCSGLLSAVLGIGGGAVIVPGLKIFVKFDMKKAVGTSLAAIIPISALGTLLYFLDDMYHGRAITVDVAAVLYTAAGTIIGAYLGAKVVSKIKSHILEKIFAVILIITAIKLCNIFSFSGQPTEIKLSYIYLIPTGVFAGFASALVGIGGGIVIVPILTMFFLPNIHSAIPTSLAIVLPTSIFAALFHKKMDNIDKTALPFMIIPAFAGVILGLFIKNSLPEDTLKIMFSILLVVMSIKMFIFSAKPKNEKPK